MFGRKVQIRFEHTMPIPIFQCPIPGKLITAKGKSQTKTKYLMRMI
jgi:hypothetical protein